MRSIRQTFRGPCLLTKTQQNRAVLLRTRFTTLWRSEIHINLKIDADAGVAFVSAVKYIISLNDREGSMVISAHEPTVCAV